MALPEIGTLYNPPGDAIPGTLASVWAQPGGPGTTVYPQPQDSAPGFMEPPIIPSGPLQTVVASPTNGAAITFSGATGTVGATMTTTTSRISIIANESAFAFVNAPLARKLAGAETGQLRDAEAGISMRYVEQYNIQTDQEPRRIDMLVGNAVVQPYYAFRAWS